MQSVRRVFAHTCTQGRCTWATPAVARVNYVPSRACTVHAAEELATTEQPTAAEPLPTYAADIRVGKILTCELHPDADSLYVESIDVGEEEPRTIISGLVKYVPVEQMLDRHVIVLCNLKARNMRGIKSHGMVLCASDQAHEIVEPLQPPAEAQLGERIYFEENQGEPEKENKVQKKKLWEAIQPDLKTGEDKVAKYKDVVMMTSAGPVTAPTLANGNIS